MKTNHPRPSRPLSSTKRQKIMKFEVTLKDLRHAGACYPGYNKLVRALQGKPFTEEDNAFSAYIHYAHDKPIQISTILESNGFDDALWALRCVKNADRDIRLFGVWCARQVQHLIEDQRSCDALDMSEQFANGKASAEALAAACDAARAAARDAARDAAQAAAGHAAGDSAQAAACEAACDAAWDAAQAAAGHAAGDSAWTAAGHAAWDAAWDASWGAEAEMFKLMCQGQAPWQTKGD